MRGGLPWVRVKLAASLDGRTALANGESRWITSKAARTDAQYGRARSSVVLTGVGTMLADDPALNVRVPESERQPLRVVLDSQPAHAVGFARDQSRREGAGGCGEGSIRHGVNRWNARAWKSRSCPMPTAVRICTQC